MDSKPLRVAEDPEVILTSVERRKQFDMATEMHELQRRVTGAATAHASLAQDTTALTKTIADGATCPPT